MDFITTLLGLIVFVVLVTISSNIGAIKRLILKERREHAQLNYFTYLTTGDTQKAYEALLYLFYYDLNTIDRPMARRRLYDELEPRYGQLFKDLGFRYPEFR